MSETRTAVVVGGGIVGACCAYYLARVGRPVTLIDAAGFGSGCSHGNCGYICPSHALPLAAPGALRTILGVMARRNSPIRLKPGVLLRDPGWFLAFARRCNEPDMLSAGVSVSALLGSSRSLYDELIRDERIECDWQTKGLLFVFRSPPVMRHSTCPRDGSSRPSWPNSSPRSVPAWRGDGSTSATPTFGRIA
jgi:D-amino-acid dehydrogenase